MLDDFGWEAMTFIGSEVVFHLVITNYGHLFEPGDLLKKV